MNRVGVLARTAASLACVGLAMPQSLLASGPVAAVAKSPAVAASPAPLPAIADVALRDGGTLLGQVVNPEGLPLPNAAVSLHHQNQKLATATTDANGYFAIRGVSGGVYQIAAGQGAGVYRLWAPNTAPPVAQPGALVVSGGQLLRGHLYDGPLHWLANPWIMAGIIATAIALPIALNNHDRDSSS